MPAFAKEIWFERVNAGELANGVGIAETLKSSLRASCYSSSSIAENSTPTSTMSWNRFARPADAEMIVVRGDDGVRIYFAFCQAFSKCAEKRRNELG